MYELKWRKKRKKKKIRKRKEANILCIYKERMSNG